MRDNDNVMAHPQPSITVPVTQKQDGEAIMLDQLRKQIEYYFSLQNLSRDLFLQSQLMSVEHAGSVPTEIIANFPKVKALHISALGSTGGMRSPADPTVLVQCLEGSRVVKISENGKWISPLEMPDFHSISIQNIVQGLVVPPPPPLEPASPAASSYHTSASSFGAPVAPFQQALPRTTAIVRDMPIDCSVQEIVQAFTTDNGPPENVKLNIGNTWYVSFSTEADAVTAVAAAWGKTMRGHPIQACMKSEAPVHLHQPQPLLPKVSPSHLTASPAYSQSPAFSFASYDSSYCMDHAPLLPDSVESGLSFNDYPRGAGIPVEIPIMTTPGRKKRKNKKHSKRRKSSGNDTADEGRDMDCHSGSIKQHGLKSTEQSATEKKHSDSIVLLEGASQPPLTEDNFPRLGGGVTTAEDFSWKKENTRDYAKVLLNGPTKADTENGDVALVTSAMRHLRVGSDASSNIEMLSNGEERA